MSPEASASFGREVAEKYLRVPYVQRPARVEILRDSTVDMNNSEFVAFVKGFFGVLDEHEAQGRRAPP
jgi:hypothetical protein